MSPRALLVLLLGTACHVQQGNEPGFSGTPEHTSGAATSADQSSSQGASETSGGGGSGELSTSAEHGDDTTPVILDVGNSADIGDGTPAGCKGKIDFLFVISRDGPMDQFQERLIKAFPKFVSTIESKFADFDYHIMVIDGDEEWGLSTCDAQCADTGTCSEVPSYPCGQLDLVTQCDSMIGAGNVFSAGGYAYNGPCAIAGGRRFLARDQPDLAETFKCIAQIGVLNAKNGDPNSVVMLDIGDPSKPWQDRIWQMTEMFRYGLVTQKYDLDYGPAFDEATDLVEDACAGFVPPG